MLNCDARGSETTNGRVKMPDVLTSRARGFRSCRMFSELLDPARVASGVPGIHLGRPPRLSGLYTYQTKLHFATRARIGENCVRNARG